MRLIQILLLIYFVNGFFLYLYIDDINIFITYNLAERSYFTSRKTDLIQCSKASFVIMYFATSLF